MEPLRRLNIAMGYIEANLGKEIDFQKVAQLACCSEYHFRRLFSFLCAMPLSEYIRRRRLAQAAMELCSSNAKIIDIAVKYGYESPDSFSRAFQNLHGVAPSEVRKNGALLKAVPPMTFQLTIQGANEMEYRIVEKEAFYIVGLKKRVTLQYNGVNPEISAMWASLSEADIKELKLLSSEEPAGLINASVNFTEGRKEGTELDQLIGVATNKSHSQKWQEIFVPASTWAVFTSRGKFPETLQNIWGRIYSEWFVMSEYELREGPEILWNESKDVNLPDFHSEIWIPVKKATPISEN